MKRTLTGFLLTFTFALSYSYNIDLRISGQKSSDIILTRYFGEKNILIDTAGLNENGYWIFKGDQKLQSGIYVFITDNKKTFEILIDDDDEFSITTDTTDLFFNLEITGASESEAFLNHQKNIIKKQKLTMILQNALQQIPATDRRVDDIQNKLAQVKTEIGNLNNLFLIEHGGRLSSNIVRATLPVPVPQFDIPVFSANSDSLMWIQSLMYFTSHYFDNIDLTDERMLNTPILFGKLEAYFKQVLFQETDSICSAANRLLNTPNINPDIKNYIIGYLLENYNKFENLGFEDVLLYLSENFMKDSEDYYIDYKVLNSVRYKLNYLEQTKLGKPVPELVMKNVSGNDVSLRNLKAQHTLLLFWNPDCEHCQAELRILKEYYNQPLFSGVEIYAVYTQEDHTKWTKHIHDHGYSWINVYDPGESTDFTEKFQVYYTPKIYLLDKNKKIVAKSSNAMDIIRLLYK